MTSNGFFTSSPTVVLSPAQPDQPFVNGHYAVDTNATLTPNITADHFAANDSVLVPGRVAGRKRSRADIYDPEEEAQDPGDGSVITSAPASIQPRDEPTVGPGMTLIYPEDPRYVARPESQSVTWVEENAARNNFQLPQAGRPAISTRKSQRMGSTIIGPDDLAQLVLPPEIREVTAEPLIDEATRTLGISWTRMDASEALLINQAAYSKWIQNHYPNLQDVSIWFENSALPGYLVAAQNSYSGQQEFYIFSNDLTEARLVTIEPAQLVPRLQMLPALELAAPGGTIRAEAESSVATPSGVPEVQTEMVDAAPIQAESPLSPKTVHKPRISLTDEEIYSMMRAGVLRGFCSAHDMDMDYD